MQFSDIMILLIGVVVVLSIVVGLLQVSKMQVVSNVKDSATKKRGKNASIDDDDLGDTPGNTVFDHLKASTEAELNYDYKESLRSLEKALEVAPNNPTVLYKMGKVLNQLGDTDKAKDYFKRLARMTPHDIKPQLELARLYANAGDIRNAEKYSEQALKINPKHESALKMKALVLTKKDDGEGSTAVFTELMQQYPQNLTYQRQYAQNLKKQKKWNEVIQFYNGMMVTCPQHKTEYLMEIAMVYFETRNYQQSVDSFRGLIDSEGQDVLDKQENLRESFAASLSNLGAQHQNAGDLQLAEECYREAMNYDDSNPDILFNYGKVLADSNRLMEAKQQFNRVLEISPDDADSLYELGRIYDRNNDIEKSRELYEQCLEKNPRFARAAFGLGTIYGVMGELERSMDYLKQAIQLDPNNVDALYNLAVCHERMDEKNKAVQLYRKVLQMNNRHEDARNNLANLKEELGIS